MTVYDIIQHVREEAATYADDEFELFKADYGWQDWMNDYTETGDDEEISEEESREIDRLIEEGWKTRKTYWGEKIKKARINAGFSQTDMAVNLEIPKRTIENWEQGSREPAAWAAKLIIEKLTVLARTNIEHKMKILANKQKSDEYGKRPAGSWAVIREHDGDEFIDLFVNMDDAIEHAKADQDKKYFSKITVGYILCNVKDDRSLEPWYVDRDGNVISEFYSIEI